MYRRYYSYNDMPQMVNKNEKCDTEHKNDCNKKEEKCREIHKPECEKKEEKCDKPVKCCDDTQQNKLFGMFEVEDIILAVIILALLLDDDNDCDNILLLALVFVFLTGKI